MFLDSPLKIYCYAIATPVFEMLRKYGVKCTYRTFFERKSSVFDWVESPAKGGGEIHLTFTATKPGLTDVELLTDGFDIWLHRYSFPCFIRGDGILLGADTFREFLLGQPGGFTNQKDSCSNIFHGNLLTQIGIFYHAVHKSQERISRCPYCMWYFDEKAGR